MASAVRFMSAFPTPPFWPDEPGDQSLLQTAKRLLASPRGYALRQKELAAALGVDARRIATLFRRHLGMTPAQFMREERMLRAQRLLLQTSSSLSDIAAQLGFSSAASFSSAFRDYTGMAPSSFRKSAPMESITALRGAIQWSSPQSSKD